MDITLPSWLTSLLRIFIFILMPIVLVLTNVRVMLTPLYINWEYNLADFPADPYGFTKADRLKYSAIALDFLLNDAGIEFLGDQRFPDGVLAPIESQADYIPPRDSTYMYNDRELKHMDDVKKVVKGVLNVWAIGGLIWVASIALLAWQPATHPILRSGLLIGSVITFTLLLGLGLYIAVGFSTFFVQFHQVFFEGNSWIFLWSDTLIRLFPTKFWYDVFLWISVGTVVEAAAIGAFAWWGLKQ
jgi:integral membrane protein (TIGR01906 family)